MFQQILMHVIKMVNIHILEQSPWFMHILTNKMLFSHVSKRLRQMSLFGSPNASVSFSWEETLFLQYLDMQW